MGVKVIIEGEEETLSHLEEYVEKHPDMFKADCMIIADMGNIGGRMGGAITAAMFLRRFTEAVMADTSLQLIAAVTTGRAARARHGDRGGCAQSGLSRH